MSGHDHDDERDDPDDTADGHDLPGDPDLPADSDSDSDSDSADPTDADGPDEDAPLSDLAGRVSRGDFGGGDDDLFDREDTPQIDREELWRQVADEETAQQAVEEIDDNTGTVTDPRPGGDADDETGERVVEKSAYCHSCRFFSAPPDVGCTHEGTEILEAVDMEHFRVRDCPIVAENEALEEF